MLTIRKLIDYQGRTWINRARPDHRVEPVRGIFRALVSSLVPDRVAYLDFSGGAPRVTPLDQLIDEPTEVDRFLFCDDEEIGDGATRFLVVLQRDKSLQDLIVFVSGLDPEEKLYSVENQTALVKDVAEVAWARDPDGGSLECYQHQ